jgi:hypothetical protein
LIAFLDSSLVMPYLNYLYDAPYFFAIQAALTIWMLVDAHRRGVEMYWYWIILVFQPLGTWAYFVLYKLGDFRGASSWSVNLFHRPPSMHELRYLAERSPTMANHLALGERLVEQGEHAEAVPHLEAVLDHEPEHGQALFALAQCRRGLSHPDQAVPLLERVIARHSAWGNYRAWHALIEAREEAGDAAGALQSCRDLARTAPTLEHKCLLAEHLVEAGEAGEARKLLEQALEDYHYLPGPLRRRNSSGAGKAKHLLKTIP